MEDSNAGERKVNSAGRKWLVVVNIFFFLSVVVMGIHLVVKHEI